MGYRVVRGGWTLAADGTGLERGDVLLRDGDIEEVGPAVAAPPGADVVEAADHVVLPGLINGHTHSHSNISRGLAAAWSLEDLLTFGPALTAGMTPEDQYVSAALGAVEMLKTGCTAACDLFMAFPAPTREGIEAVVRAYADVGLRAIVAPAVADIVFHRTVPGLLDLLPGDLRRTVEGMTAQPADALLRLTDETIARWDGAEGGRIRCAVAPTIPGQCTDELLAGLARIARERDAPVHTHVAESPVQVAHGHDRWGRSLVAQLDRAGLLGPDFTAVHAIWVTDDDIALLGDRGSSVVHNPGSNLRLGAGIARVREMLDAGVVVGLGTDGSATSDNQNMLEAMRLASLVNRIRFPYHQDRWLHADEPWAMATTGNARIVRRLGRIGALAPGHKADLVLVRRDSAFLQPLNDPLSSLVLSETGAAVSTVIVDGRVVLRDGTAVGVDETDLYRRGREIATRLRSSNGHAWELGRRLTPYVAQACRAAATGIPGV